MKVIQSKELMTLWMGWTYLYFFFTFHYRCYTLNLDNIGLVVTGQKCKNYTMHIKKVRDKTATSHLNDIWVTLKVIQISFITLVHGILVEWSFNIKWLVGMCLSVIFWLCIQNRVATFNQMWYKTSWGQVTGMMYGRL